MNKKVKVALFAIGLLLASGGFTQMLQAKPNSGSGDNKNLAKGMCVPGKGVCGKTVNGTVLYGGWFEFPVQ